MFLLFPSNFVIADQANSLKIYQTPITVMTQKIIVISSLFSCYITLDLKSYCVGTDVYIRVWVISCYRDNIATPTSVELLKSESINAERNRSQGRKILNKVDRLGQKIYYMCYNIHILQMSHMLQISHMLQMSHVTDVTCYRCHMLQMSNVIDVT